MADMDTEVSLSYGGGGAETHGEISSSFHSKFSLFTLNDLLYLSSGKNVNHKSQVWTLESFVSIHGIHC